MGLSSLYFTSRILVYFTSADAGSARKRSSEQDNLESDVYLNAGHCRVQSLS